MTSAVGDLVTASGFWSPVLAATAILAYLCIMVVVIFISSRSVVTRETYVKREEMLKPFLCGEDVSLLEHVSSYHLYYVLTDVVKIGNIRNHLDIDRIYYALSRNFSRLCVKVLRLDIKQQYFPAVLSFMVGTVIVILIAILLG